MELFTLFGKIATNADEANKDIDNITSNAEKSEGRMTKAFKKIGTAIVTAFAVDKIIDFGKQMIETTAKIQALDSQFTQTFKGDQAKALDLITKQAKEQGINVDRLKGTWASFYGTFRGNGADANQALELTNKYMRLAADGAAYYDLTLEDVSSRLKSLVMGNFEAGDAIGVNINATKMDTAAKKEYGKAWKDLTDTQKEFLLINTVSKIYENSGAMGQGAREANNWSNVTENLKATWDRFLNVLGSPILSGAVKIVQGLTGIVEQLQARVQSFNITDFIKKLSDTGGTAGAVGNALNILKDIFLTVKDRFVDIVTNIIQVAKKWYTDNQDTINRLINTFSTCMTYIKQIINDAVTIILFIWNNFGKYIFDFAVLYLQLLLDRVRNILGVISGIFKVITSLIKGDWQSVWDGIKQIFSNVLEFIVRLLIEQLLGNFIKKIGQWGSSLLGKVKTIISDVTGSFSGLISGITSKVSPIIDILTKPFSGAFDNIAGWISKIKNAISNIFDTYIKKPHFSFSGSLNPINWPTEGLPKLSVDWYAKGGIFNRPSIIGVGEAGTEAVLPIDRLDELMARAIEKVGMQGRAGINQTINIYSPTASPSEVARQVKKASQRLALDL
ncbi:hypothetical protein M2651_05820 [Clostridium sp. SYSU_GA19001]|uniref:phage tail protein n=1 Tax=Clostridium caldaquaticum TaxID=2940653 RepID=UPI0020772D7D|nr:hypothetical protein [Clostridium caldaquaticum]MCM8710543.1 hypothetical protein [Clostridium caldaquaticum]